MKTHPGFIRWDHHAAEAQVSPVFPDGCRDVLIIRQEGEPVRIVLTEFDFSPRRVLLRRGASITGYRLRPGAAVGPAVLDAIAANSPDAETILTSEIGAPDEMDEAIDALALAGSKPGSVSRSLGVSDRTLQRRFRNLGLPPPDFWRLLARARRAIGLLTTGVPLAALAHDCGFSDQAHLTREVIRWSGFSPAQLRRDAHLIELLRQPALGNWTGEQISTRYTSGSLT